LTSPTITVPTYFRQAGAQNTSVQVLVAEARTSQEIVTAFAMMAGESTGAVIVGAAPLFALHRPQIAQLAIKYKMPPIFGNRDYVEAGGLMS
jgi:putative ABC transport system substrate-binding protein